MIPDLNQISYIRANGSYIDVFYSDGSTTLFCRGLSYWQKILPKEDIIRIHHSYLINKSTITDFSLKDRKVVLKGTICLSISRRKLKTTLVEINLPGTIC